MTTDVDEFIDTGPFPTASCDWCKAKVIDIAEHRCPPDIDKAHREAEAGYALGIAQSHLAAARESGLGVYPSLSVEKLAELAAEDVVDEDAETLAIRTLDADAGEAPEVPAGPPSGMSGVRAACLTFVNTAGALDAFRTKRGTADALERFGMAIYRSGREHEGEDAGQAIAERDAEVAARTREVEEAAGHVDLMDGQVVLDLMAKYPPGSPESRACSALFAHICNARDWLTRYRARRAK